MLVLASSAVAVAGACLPDLEAFPPAPDASDPSVTVQTLGCGDGVIETLDDGGDAGESCDPGDASVAGCESCRFTCPGAIDDAGHCYFIAESTSTYNAAIGACAAADGHVVTFASERESTFVTSLIESTIGADAGFWVGLSVRDDRGGYAPPLDLSEPGWPNGASTCAGCFAVGADDAGAFALHPNEEAGVSASCLVAENGTWLRVPCVGTTARRTVCEREPVGQRIYPCGGLLCTTLAVTLGAKRYVIWQFPQTADQASALCRDTYAGGRLVMFDTREEREQLARELRQRLPTELEIWIGLSSTGGGWAWDDGQPLDGGRPVPWANGEPAVTAGRAFLRIDDQQFDTQLARTDPDASAARIFVCERPVE